MSSKPITNIPGAYVNTLGTATAINSSSMNYTYIPETYTTNNNIWFTPASFPTSWYIIPYDSSENKKKESEEMTNKNGDTFTIQQQPIQKDYCPNITFNYKNESLHLGGQKDWVGRLGVLDHAKTLLIEQLDNGGYLTEHAWSSCVRRAESDLKEASKGIMALASWLSECKVNSDHPDDDYAWFSLRDIKKGA